MTASARASRTWLRLAALALTLLTACSGLPLSKREQALVNLYLECYDCVSPLDSVKAIGKRKPRAAVDSLNRALVAGPGAGPGANPGAGSGIDSVLVLAFVRDSTYRVYHGQPPLPMTRAGYVADQHGRYDAGYQSRGAVGLGWIHDARAVADLNAALALPLPQSVLRAVKFAIDSLP